MTQTGGTAHFQPLLLYGQENGPVFNGKRPSQKTFLPFSACGGSQMASRKDSGSVSSTVMTSTGGTLDSPVKQIQIEGLVSDTQINFGGGCERNVRMLRVT